ncbi:hypothetical protein [Shouchella shacheensis]|uniref:hypothetical protein n=1 Tax=Shouchella shacheensis TaxID=1649580 RepID=UPI00073FB57C|nr:hypothetical protein [Shouchella shacheensis]
MKQVIPSTSLPDAENKLSVLRLEIDYELMTLHDALLEEDVAKSIMSKRRLRKLRREWLELERAPV